MNAEIAHIITWYQAKLDSGGYPLVAAMMAGESTILPIPSELVIPFAVQRAHATGNMTVVGVVVASVVGSWVGAAIMYWVCRLAGRPLVLRYGGYFLVTEPKIHAAEHWAARFGASGVFIARLLPFVRHLIGIPMGILEMDFRLYSLLTLAGSAVWCAVLAWAGVVAGNDPGLLHGDILHVMLWLFALIFLWGVLYYRFVRPHLKKPQS